MAFLKDHKVENHVIFPGRGLRRDGAGSRRAAFRGAAVCRSRISKFASRSSCRIRHPACRSSSPIRRTSALSPFRAVSSKASPGRSTSSVRCAASARNPPLPPRNASNRPSTQAVAVEGFLPSHERSRFALWRRISARARTVRRRRAIGGPGQLCRTRSRRARANIALHPVLFDGALQVFSAGAATVEGRQARMKLPVAFRPHPFSRFARGLQRGAANVREFGDDFIEGDIALYDEAGKPCVLVDGFRAISLSGAGRSRRRAARAI